MEKLKPVKHDLPTKMWCGLAAISSVTGLPTSKVIETAKRITGRRAIMGMSNGLVINVLNALGYQVTTVRNFASKRVESTTATVGDKVYKITGFSNEFVPAKQRPTLARYTRQYREDFQEHACIVGVTGHWVAVYGRRFIDNSTGEPVFLRQSPHRRARVERVFQVRVK